MTVQEIANQLVSLCNQGKFEEAVEALYSPDIVSIEPRSGGVTERIKGLHAYHEKGKKWQGMLEAFHGSEMSKPVVAGQFFTCKMVLDVTMKGGVREKSEEICLYQVQDQKIVKEQFFYDLPTG